jgi:hypothetical protein
MFSYHPDTTNVFLHYRYTNQWRRYDVNTPEAVARAIVKCVTSPHIWRGGVRRTEQWDCADWVVADVDNGATLKEALALLDGLTYVVGTTKSHRASKKRVICDRFRVWVRLAERCYNLEDYKATGRHIAKLLGGDMQAVDGARKFLPCRQIIASSEGADLPITPAPPLVQQALPKLHYIPKFIREFLQNGAPEGIRSLAVYKCGIFLGNNGYTENEILDIVMGSQLNCIPRREIVDSIRSGLRKIKCIA